MKILFICGEYPPGPHGGIGTFNQLIARWLVQQSHQVKVIGVYDKTYGQSEYEEDHGVQVYRIFQGEGKFGWIRGWYQQYRQIKRWIDQNEVQIIEAPDSRGWFAFWPKLRIPLVIRAHGSETYFSHLAGKKPNRLTHFLESKSYHRADFYAAVSKYVAAENERLFGLSKKHTIIYNSLPPEALEIEVNATSERNNQIVYSGTLIQKKGVFSLIAAVLKLFNQGMDFTLMLNGKDFVGKDGVSTQGLLQKMIPEEFKGRIIFNGHQQRANLYQMYRQAAVAVFPSYAEAFAIAPMEAMLNACPVVYTSRVSGPELIESRKNGILVDPDDIQALADAIEFLLKNKEEAKRIGESGRDIILQQFSYQNVMMQNEIFYQKCISDFSSE
jgi:glycosyltransferase involved in cell wall biosynthesis